MACLMMVPSVQVPPRFFRVHFLTALGLTGVTLAFSIDLDHHVLSAMEYRSALVVALVTLFFGSMVWHLEKAPFGRWLMIFSSASLLYALAFLRWNVRGDHFSLLADDLTSAAVLGSSVTAMLIGHSYLIAPGMSLTPLLRMLAVLAACLLVRMALAGIGLWFWTDEIAAPLSQTETMLWLAVRWVLGLFAPLVLGWMAWETAQIRSTQSATGILYVVVIVCFLGELTSQLLLQKTGHIL